MHPRSAATKIKAEMCPFDLYYAGKGSWFSILFSIETPHRSFLTTQNKRNKQTEHKKQQQQTLIESVYRSNILMQTVFNFKSRTLYSEDQIMSLEE
jgi:hypothetical protein